MGSDYSVLDEFWDFRLKAKSIESATKSMVEYDFSTSLRDGCLLDVLTNPSSIENFVYYLDDSGLHTVPSPTYTQLVANCNIDW